MTQAQILGPVRSPASRTYRQATWNGSLADVFLVGDEVAQRLQGGAAQSDAAWTTLLTIHTADGSESIPTALAAAEVPDRVLRNVTHVELGVSGSLDLPSVQVALGPMSPAVHVTVHGRDRYDAEATRLLVADLLSQHQRPWSHGLAAVAGVVLCLAIWVAGAALLLWGIGLGSWTLVVSLGAGGMAAALLGRHLWRQWFKLFPVFELSTDNEEHRGHVVSGAFKWVLLGTLSALLGIVVALVVDPYLPKT